MLIPPLFSFIFILKVINGQPTRYFNSKEKIIRQLISAGGCLVCFVLVVVSLLVFYFIRLIFGDVFTYIIVAVVIQIMNGVFLQLSVYLTDGENHRLESDYEESLIAKLYLFQFINSYAMLFYIAFFRQMVGDDCSGGQGCMGELSLALLVIFGYRLIIGNAQEFLWPIVEPHFRSGLKMVKRKVVEWYRAEPDVPEASWVDGIQQSLAEEEQKELQEEHRKRLMDQMSMPEREFNLDEYSAQDQAVSEYSDLAVEFGFVTFFVAAFPLAPLFALANNFFQIRIDATKMLSSLRRPMPASSNGIGIWLDIYQINSIIAVITNSGIVAFAMNPSTVGNSSFNLFIGMQYSLFALMALANYIVPDVPDSVPFQLKRQEFLVHKIIKGVADPEEGVFTAHTKDLQVYQEDGDINAGRV